MVSLLPILAKIFEKVLAHQIFPFPNDVLSPHLSAFRRGYSCQDALLGLFEHWRKDLLVKKKIGAPLRRSTACLTSCWCQSWKPMVFSQNLLNLFYPIFPTDNSMSVSAESAVHGKPPAKESHKDLFSVLCFSMFLLMIYFILSKLSCLQIMQMITLFTMRI